MVRGCRKSRNSRISTAYTISTPKVMATLNFSNISRMYSASPYSIRRTPAGSSRRAGKASMASSAVPSVVPDRSASTEILRSRADRSMRAGRCRIRCPRRCAAPPSRRCRSRRADCPAPAGRPVRARAAAARTGTCRSAKLKRAELALVSPTVAMRATVPIDAAVTPARAASSARGRISSSGAAAVPLTCTLARPGSARMSRSSTRGPRQGVGIRAGQDDRHTRAALSPRKA